MPKAIDEYTIDISDMNKAEVLRRLFNAAKTGGAGVLKYDPLYVMTVEEAQHILDVNTGRTYFDWYMGRVMKVDIVEEAISVRLYDRDNGKGAALRALTAPST